MAKPYGKINFTEEELLTLRGAINSVRAKAFEQFTRSEGPEKAFCSATIDKLDALSTKLEKPFEDDKSQDEAED